MSFTRMNAVEGASWLGRLCVHGRIQRAHCRRHDRRFVRHAERGREDVDAPGIKEPVDVRGRRRGASWEGLPELHLADVSEVAEAAEALAAAGWAGPADDEVDRDEGRAGEAVHGRVPAWCDAQRVLGGHTERNVQEPAVPEREALG